MTDSTTGISASASCSLHSSTISAKLLEHRGIRSNSGLKMVLAFNTESSD